MSDVVAGLDPKYVSMMLDALVNFPANGKLPSSDARTALLICKYIEEKTQTKQCSTCGHDKPDYIYFKITAGGKYFMAAALKGNQ